MNNSLKEEETKLNKKDTERDASKVKAEGLTWKGGYVMRTTRDWRDSVDSRRAEREREG